MSDLKVCLFESELHWENPDANRVMFDQMINMSDKDVELFVLPEMFTTGFTMQPEGLSEPENGPTLQWMKSTAFDHDAAITGSIIVKDKVGYKNRMYFVQPDGQVDYYDKRHLFSYAGEDQFYKPGTEKKVVSFKGWNILLQVCFDLRFPVFSRNRMMDYQPEYDIAIYVANWPKQRVYAWDALLKARAIENLAYFIGVNRVGKDGNDVEYVGHSSVVDPLGKSMGLKGGVYTLKKSELYSVRERFQFLKEQDAFKLK